MNLIQDKAFQSKSILYANIFLKGFTDYLDSYEKDLVHEVLGKGYPILAFQFYKKKLGTDLSIAIFIANSEFYLFFVKPTGKEIKIFKNEYFNNKFEHPWTAIPLEAKINEVKKLLRLNSSDTIGNPVSIGGTSFITENESHIIKNAEDHGRGFAERDSNFAKAELPNLRKFVELSSKKLSIRLRFADLKKFSTDPTNSPFSPQKIGHEFEKLIRGVLELYGWQPKKIQLPYEGNDFTAMYLTQHILGEVRWEKKELKGEDINAFAGKLAPRPQTIGLMFSMSGFNSGAYTVARTLLADNKTIVLLGKPEIEEIIDKLMDPGEVFTRELREVYDKLFEDKIKKPRNTQKLK